MVNYNSKERLKAKAIRHLDYIHGFLVEAKRYVPEMSNCSTWEEMRKVMLKLPPSKFTGESMNFIDTIISPKLDDPCWLVKEDLELWGSLCRAYLQKENYGDEIHQRSH